MGDKKTILAVVGTRPEGIKMAPVIRTLRETDWARVRVMTTAQHRELLDEVFEVFDIQPHLDLDLMRANQSLAGLTGRLAHKIDEVLEAEQPDMVLAQGDTTTVMVTALCCFYRRIPFGHVEAGLRTHDRNSPFPEEMNRVFAGYLGDQHFAPTTTARDNLLREGIAPDAVHVTGNTVIDALLYQIDHPGDVTLPLVDGLRTLLVTAHRRENFGAPLQQVCRAIRTLVERFPDMQVLFPVHPNPNVRRVTDELLAGHPRINLCEPLGYSAFVAAMQRADLILTDSGGVQEEAPALAKPVLVLRNETERPEAVDAGVVKLVGTNEATIIAEASRLWADAQAYREMARGVSPYGDGHAASRIVDLIRRRLLATDTPSAGGGMSELPAGQVEQGDNEPRLQFICNICNTHNDVALARLDREKRSCTHCASSVRTRAMIHLLSMALFDQSLAIDDFPVSPRLRGIGLSDWPGYANRLPHKLGYVNSYYHQEPKLDITNVPPERFGSCDFLISTDVFEHVLAPVSAAFSGAYNLLKPGGAMMFSVPFTNHGHATVEHFDALHDFEVIEDEGAYRLVNRRADGHVDTYDNLKFHGGPGSTLEMRLFCRESLLDELQNAGFQVELFDHPVESRGIVWQQSWSVPLLARKP